MDSLDAVPGAELAHGVLEYVLTVVGMIASCSATSWFGFAAGSSLRSSPYFPRPAYAGVGLPRSRQSSATAGSATVLGHMQNVTYNDCCGQ
ncbi:MAG TPA: hypothetical protein VJS67_14605 [Pseudonocardiaceae bacterium]|nr:hypothetical protein [Pseudonocardiaceae bacterium]